MNKDEIKKALKCCADIDDCDDCPYDVVRSCIDRLKLDACELIIEQENEIEKLKAENVRLTTKLGQVLLSIDTVKEMNTMCSIDEQRKQAKIDVLNELKEKCKFDGHMVAVYKNDIDEMIAEVLNAEDKG